MSRTKKRIIHNKRWVTGLFAIGLTLACLISTLLALEVYAVSTGKVTLTIEQIITDNITSMPPNETFVYRLASKTPDAPMPYGISSADYAFTITGTDEKQIGPISFNTPGIFIYELSCTTNSSSAYIIDQRVYIIEVHVTNDLQTATIVYINSGTKIPEIYFEHVYQSLPSNPSFPNDPDDPDRGAGGFIIKSAGTNTSPYTPAYESDLPSMTVIPTEPVNLSESVTPDELNVSNQSGSSPKTGDFSNPTLWITLIVIASTLLAILSFIGMKSKERGDH